MKTADRRFATRRQKRIAKRRAAHAWLWARETRRDRKGRGRWYFIVASKFLIGVPRTDVRYRSFTRDPAPLHPPERTENTPSPAQSREIAPSSGAGG